MKEKNKGMMVHYIWFISSECAWNFSMKFRQPDQVSVEPL